MTTLSTPGTYVVQPSDTLIRVTNNIATIVYFAAAGGSIGQEVTVQDASGQSQVSLQISGIGTLILTNYEKLTVSWNSQTGAWQI